MQEVNGLNVEVKGESNTIEFDEETKFLRSRIMVSGENNTIILGSALSYSNFVINIKGNNKKIVIANSRKNINGLKIVSIRGEGQVVKIGDNFSCGGMEIQMNDENETLTIGDNCLFSWGIKARTSDGHSIVDLNTDRAVNLPKDISIADRVWVGEDVSFLKGSKISSDSVVGSRSVVTKAFDKTNVVIAGFPAVIVKENIKWDRRRPSEYNGAYSE
tara:strand:+ start:5690 stop:6340 length:651 start_codon:yes stop_codon:yes gene_type:complete